MARDSKTTPVIALTEAQRQVAMKRFAVLQPHLDEDVPLARAARHARVPVRTAERWLARYRQQGLAGLARPSVACLPIWSRSLKAWGSRSHVPQPPPSTAV